MKVKVDSVEDKFKPVIVAITCETKQELGALFAFFNHAVLSSIAMKNGLKPFVINEAIRKENVETPDYHKCHEQLMKVMA